MWIQPHPLDLCSAVRGSCIRLHGEGGVYDLYWDKPPGGDRDTMASLLRISVAHLLRMGNIFLSGYIRTVVYTVSLSWLPVDGNIAQKVARVSSV